MTTEQENTMTENTTAAAEPLTEEQQAEMVQAYLKTKDQAASAKASLDDEKQRLAPFEEAKKAADKEHAEAKKALNSALGRPGAKFTTAAGTASLSRPKTTITRELDMEAFIEHMREKHPKMLERFTRDVPHTPAPRLTVKGA